MIVFLAAVGFFMWILKGYTVFDSGVSSMAALFELAPYLFIFLVSAITMRSFSDEKRLGTIEIITTKPVSDLAIIMGKFFACLALVLFSLLPTLIYYYSISKLGNPPGNMDIGGMWGSYFGLLLLGAAYVSIGIFCSSVSDNQIVALIFSMFLCFFFYQVIGMIGDVSFLKQFDNSIDWFGLELHYRSISRGVLDTRDLLYFASFSAFFIWLTKLVFGGRKI